jgi:hypothetical protein
LPLLGGTVLLALHEWGFGFSASVSCSSVNFCARGAYTRRSTAARGQHVQHSICSTACCAAVRKASQRHHSNRAVWVYGMNCACAACVYSCTAIAYIHSGWQEKKRYARASNPPSDSTLGPVLARLAASTSFASLTLSSNCGKNASKLCELHASVQPRGGYWARVGAPSWGSREAARYQSSSS